MRIYLASLTNTQLHRFHCKLWKRITRRTGSTSMDWTYLHSFHPGLSNLLENVFAEKSKRNREFLAKNGPDTI